MKDWFLVVGCLLLVEDGCNDKNKAKLAVEGCAFPNRRAIRRSGWGTRAFALVEENRQRQKQMRGFFAPLRMTKDVGWVEENKQRQKQVPPPAAKDGNFFCAGRMVRGVEAAGSRLLGRWWSYLQGLHLAMMAVWRRSRNSEESS